MTTTTRMLTAAAAAVLGLAPMPASAGTGPTHKNVHFTQTYELASVSAVKDVFAIRDTVAGNGAGVAITKFLSSTQATDTGIEYFRGGTISAADRYTLGAPDANGVIAITGRGHATGGTGRFKHVHATYTFTGSYDAKANVGHLEVKGTMSY